MVSNDTRLIVVSWPAGRTRPGPRQSTAGAHWLPFSPTGSGSVVVSPVTVTPWPAYDVEQLSLGGQYSNRQPHWKALTLTVSGGVEATASMRFSATTVKPKITSTMMTGTTV